MLMISIEIFETNLDYISILEKRNIKTVRPFLIEFVLKNLNKNSALGHKHILLQ